MGNLKPKKPRKTWPVELNTQTFRDMANARIDENEAHNGIVGVEHGHEQYRIASQADVAAELSRLTGKKIGQTQVQRILGGARGDTEVALIAKSQYIRPIREMLKLERKEILVPTERADVLEQIAELPEKDFARHREAVESKKPT